MLKFKNSKGEVIFEIKDEDCKPKRLRITKDGNTTIIEEVEEETEEKKDE